MQFKQNFLKPVIVLVCSSLFLLTGCDAPKNQNREAQLPAVKTFKVEPLTYTLKISLPARVVASQIAEIRPQVGGIILKREFEESSNVKAGQSLYQIDPAIYQANYDSAVANVASAKASANIADLTLKRYAELLKTKAISQQDYDKAAAEALQAEANVLVAQASEHTAKVNLDYTKVYSPIDGYIGKSSVTEGALVSTGQSTSLATVQKLDPLYVDMTVSATRYNKYMQDGNTIYQPMNKDNVHLFFNDGTEYTNSGYIKFSDMSVNETTGTVTLRAEFPNPEKKILPGMFIKSQITLGKIDNAVIVPQQGVTSNEMGQYTAIVVVPIPEDQELSVITDSLTTISKDMDDVQIKAVKAKAQEQAKQMIEDLKNSDKKDKRFYYLEQRNNIAVYDGITGYWIVTSGINTGEKIATSGLLNLTGKNLNDPNKRVLVDIINETPDSLSQEQLNQIINSSIK